MKTVKKYKISRRLKTPLFEKTQTQKFALREQARAPKRFGMQSEFGKQLLEKQKIRFLYSITERNLQKYVDTANKKSHTSAASAQNILAEMLDRRLDSVVYFLGLADTRRMARQMVSHAHFTVNGKKNNIPSYQVKQGDIIAVKDSHKNSTLFKKIFEAHKGSVPAWLTWDSKTQSGTVAGAPEGERGIINFSSVLEYYSR